MSLARSSRLPASQWGMSEINVVAVFKVQPQFRERYTAALIEMAEQTHANDEGCLLYSLQQSTTDPNTFVFIEKWTSEAALDAHGAQPHLTQGRAERDAMLAEPGVVIRLRGLGAGDPVLGSF